MNNQTNDKHDRFWSSFKRKPNVQGRKVLEIGCGSGNRCLELLRMGAKEVVGIDIIGSEIEKAYDLCDNANDIPQSSYRFFCTDIADLDEYDFDLVVSENTFEHILDVEGTLREIDKRTNRKAEILLGFGPLYYSPYGDHGWMRAVLPFRRYFSWPWGHILFPESFIFQRLSEKTGTKVTDSISWPYLALNKMKYKQYIRAFQNSSFKTNEVAINPGYSFMGRLMKLLSYIPGLKSYTVWGIFAILRKD